MGKTGLSILIVLLLSGCGAMPAKQSTPMAAFNRLIVRDINWKETAVSEVEGKEMTEYIAAQPRLNQIFREEFRKYISKTGYFADVAYGDATADAGALILLPKIYNLKPCGYMPEATYTGLLVAADGRLVASYDADRRLSQGKCSNSLENIEKLVAELGEDAASLLPFAGK